MTQNEVGSFSTPNADTSSMQFGSGNRLRVALGNANLALPGVGARSLLRRTRPLQPRIGRVRPSIDIVISRILATWG